LYSFKELNCTNALQSSEWKLKRWQLFCAFTCGQAVITCGQVKTHFFAKWYSSDILPGSSGGTAGIANISFSKTGSL